MKTLHFNSTKNTFNEQSENLLIIFGGFGFEEEILEILPKEKILAKGYDILYVYDYSNIDFSFSKEFQSYKNVKIIAWSFGVSFANLVLEKIKKINNNISSLIACSGSLMPISDKYSIPEKIFNLTLNNYTEENRPIFFKKVFGGEILVNTKKTASLQKDELAFIKEFFLKNEAILDNKKLWQKIYASKADRIFPLKNLKNFWEEKIVEINASHFHTLLFAINNEFNF